jgi:hypothetical protein
MEACHDGAHVDHGGSFQIVLTNGEDVLLLGDHESKASACRVLERDAPSLVPQDALDIVPVVELVVESLRHMDLLGWIAVLDDDQVVGLEERTPLLEEVEIADRGDDNVLRSKKR